MSINSLFSLLVLTETEEAEEEIVWGVNREKLPNFLTSRRLCFVSTTSLAINGFMWEVFVSWGCPKSIVSSEWGKKYLRFRKWEQSFSLSFLPWLCHRNPSLQPLSCAVVTEWKWGRHWSEWWQRYTEKRFECMQNLFPQCWRRAHSPLSRVLLSCRRVREYFWWGRSGSLGWWWCHLGQRGKKFVKSWISESITNFIVIIKVNFYQ